MKKPGLLILILVFFVFCSEKQNADYRNEQLEVKFSGEAQVEIGNHFVGLEFHHSFFSPSRISFFYPTANSIDLSKGYWERDQSQVLFFGLKTDKNVGEWIGLEPSELHLTPYSAVFERKEDKKEISVTYDFCKTRPAFVLKVNIKNKDSKPVDYELYTHLETSVKTCHSYKLIDSGWTEYLETGSCLFTNYEKTETQNTSLFVVNAGDLPFTYFTKSKSLGLPFSAENKWIKGDMNFSPEIINRNNQERPASAYIYRKKVNPGESLEVIQIIGSCKLNERFETANYLKENYQTETEEFKKYVLEKSFYSGELKTGDNVLDHSVHWSKAIVAVNRHYLNGYIVPMPCPAEYNFYFTHDVLLTDLSAVYFDIDRVRDDLEFIFSLANENNVIPHAYYWKDDKYVTEFAGSDNWNNFWFVIVSASYYRHSGDRYILEKLFPLIQKCIEQTLLNKQDDDLIWAYRPDWWDIGRNFGPRAYMNILMIKALKEFVFISTILNKNMDKLADYEKLCNSIIRSLNDKLWSDRFQYLMNFCENGKIDPHYYIGSLLAAHYQIIDNNRILQLINTAKEKLLDENLGIYNAFPMDFHELIDFYRFSGNEAGNQFYYMNGGIWSHGNAWYALALISAGKNNEAADFIKRIMSVKGIMDSPNGQPAMYEYRITNKNDPSIYGKVDKPQFMWAGGWYLYCLYQLLGLRENEWNISLEPYMLNGQKNSKFSLAVNGNTAEVNIAGSGEHIKSIRYDGKIFPSMVIPVEIDDISLIEIEKGNPEIPYLKSGNFILNSADFDKRIKSLELKLKSFTGHENILNIISPSEPASILLNGNELKENYDIKQDNDVFNISIRISQKQNIDIVLLRF